MTFIFEGDGVFAHRLVARVVRERCARDGTLNAIGRRTSTVLGLIAKSIGEPWETPGVVRELVQTVILLLVNVAGFLGEEDGELYEVLLGLCGWALMCLQQLGDSTAMAVQLGEMLVSEAERVFRTADPFMLRTRNNLGLVYKAAGRPADAIRLFEQALGDSARTLGEDHPDIMAVRSNLASVYGEVGRTADAIAISEAMLADRERLLGEDHPDTLMGLFEVNRDRVSALLPGVFS